MIRSFRSLARDERGASVIEMAMVPPLLGSLLIGMVDISRAYSAKLQLEQSAYRAIEKVQQYQTTDSTYRYTEERSRKCGASGGLHQRQRQRRHDRLLARVQRYSSGRLRPPHVRAVRRTRAGLRSISPATFTPMFSSRRWPGANTNGTFTLHGKAGLRTQ